MKSANNMASFVKAYCAIGAAISLLAIYQTQAQTQALLKLSTRYKWVVLMAVFALNAAGDLYIVLQRRGDRFNWQTLDWKARRTPLAILLGALAIVAPVLPFLLARADFFGRGGEGFFRLLWLFWWMALVQAVGWRLAAGVDWRRALALTLLVDGMTAQLFTLSSAASNYPFSVGWSEASRYYYGSLVFSRWLYGEQFPLSVMHGTRYLLQSIPFAFHGVTLWAARLWQVLLWIGLTLCSAWALIRRLRINDGLIAALAVSYLFLYFFQGAVYYHLQVCVIIILLGVSLTRPRLSLASVLAASLWAGMSRVNWFPVPAMLAIAIYLLERPLTQARGLWEYVRTPLLWGMVGLGAALAGQALYVAVSGNTNLDAFASSFTSALLWYRWLPSPTNPIGIIPGTAIVTFPLGAMIGWRLRSAAGSYHPLRLVSLGLMLVILLIGGLVVSTKIGGGGDLHNMDAYMVLLAVLAAYSMRGIVAAEDRGPARPPMSPWWIVAIMMLVPVGFSLLRLGGPFRYDPARAASDLTTLSRQVEAYGRSGEVLFMYERHLLTFGMVPKVPLVPDYEVVTLMEMAISGNERYLGRFYNDLKEHRFAAIVAHPQNLGVETGDFIEENNAWSRLVARPLLCQYKPALTLDYSGVQILVPRARPCPDFPPRIKLP